MLNMTQVFAPPSVAPKTDRQALANDNLNMFMAASGTKRKDLAAYIGKDPAMITNLLKGKNRWFYEESRFRIDCQESVRSCAKKEYWLFT